MWEHTRGKTLTDRGRQQQESAEHDEQEDEPQPVGTGQMTLDDIL